MSRTRAAIAPGERVAATRAPACVAWEDVADFESQASAQCKGVIGFYARARTREKGEAALKSVAWAAAPLRGERLPRARAPAGARGEGVADDERFERLLDLTFRCRQIPRPGAV